MEGSLEARVVELERRISWFEAEQRATSERMMEQDRLIAKLESAVKSLVERARELGQESGVHDSRPPHY